MDKKQIPIQYFKNLIAVAMADGVFHVDEKSFFIEKAEDFGLTLEEVNDLLENANEQEFVVPVTIEEKKDQLMDVVFMAMIDGELHETEYKLAIRIAEKMDMTKQNVDDIVKLVINLSK